MTTRYLYDGLDIIQERNASGAVTANYIRTLNIDEPLTGDCQENCVYEENFALNICLSS